MPFTVFYNERTWILRIGFVCLSVLFLSPVQVRAGTIAQQLSFETWDEFAVSDDGFPFRSQIVEISSSFEINNISFFLQGTGPGSWANFRVRILGTKPGDPNEPDYTNVLAVSNSTVVPLGWRREIRFPFKGEFITPTNGTIALSIEYLSGENDIAIFGVRSDVVFGGCRRHRSTGEFHSDCSIADIAYVIRGNTSAPFVVGVNQYAADNITFIPEGGMTFEEDLNFRALLSSYMGREIKLQIELRPREETFTGEFDGSIKESRFTVSNDTAEIRWNDLAEGAYRWRARAVDDLGNASDWQEFEIEGNSDVHIHLGIAKGHIAYNTNFIDSDCSTRNIGERFTVSEEIEFDSVKGRIGAHLGGNILRGATIKARIYRLLDRSDPNSVDVNFDHFSSNAVDLLDVQNLFPLRSGQEKTVLKDVGFVFERSIKLSPGEIYMVTFQTDRSPPTDAFAATFVIGVDRHHGFQNGELVTVVQNQSCGRPFVASDYDLYFILGTGTSQLPPPVILLPGILGSWTDNILAPFINPGRIQQSDLSLTENSSSRVWRALDAFGFLAHTWESLKETLLGSGVDVYECPYDWRLHNSEIADEYLKPCIDAAKSESGSDRVNIVAHSMGGLVGRSYIQSDSYRDDVDKFAMLGTPNHGAVDAYNYWEGADPLGSLIERAATDRLSRAAAHFLRSGLLAYVHSFFPSIQELLPTFDYLEDQSGATRPESGMVWRNEFLRNLNEDTDLSRLAGDIGTKIFASEGWDTPETIKVIYPNPGNFFQFGFLPYPDGLPVSTEESAFGDSRVLSQKSARITEVAVPFETATSTDLSLRHDNLPNGFLSGILEFLGVAPTTTPPVALAADPDQVLALSLASPADLLIIDSQGRRLGYDPASGSEAEEIPGGVYSGRDDIELALIVNPQPGDYQIRITGSGDGEFQTGISYANASCDGILRQENLGEIASGRTVSFTLNFEGGCEANANTYSLDAVVDIKPKKINLHGKGKHITAYLELPQGYRLEDIDLASLRLAGTASIDRKSVKIADHDKDGIRDLRVKFMRRELKGEFAPGMTTLAVSGNLNDGTRFEGTDAVEIKDKEFVENESEDD